MNNSPPSKRTKLEPSPSLSHENVEDVVPNEDAEQEHCTICLQPFLDRAIIPVCAHEFCFECILLWSEQSRKCPLCSRSFEDSYIIHHVRSQYDYQKHYLVPLRSSPPLLTGESHANALRHTRRERQWGRRQRRQRQEADQLERAIARRRWIYQHHLYAKHVASNPYTRYRPFPTPSQFAASPDLISRMTIFLRRELHVWPDLDVEFLTTYTIALMKSIDIRSESAVKLLSEFLDLDTPYAPGERRVNAEHFAHEIYSYLRSPYRDLYVYDQTAQYDTPPEISPPQDILRGSRWSPESSPPRRSRSRSSRYSILHGENELVAVTRGRDNSAGAHHEVGPDRGQSLDRFSHRIPPSSEEHGSRHRLDGAELRKGHPKFGERSRPEASSFSAVSDNQDESFLGCSDPRNDEKGKGRVLETTMESDPTKSSLAAIAPTASVSNESSRLAPLANKPPEVTPNGSEDPNDEVDHGASDGGGSSANPPSSRKRPAVHVRLRNRTLSASVLAYLSESKPGAHRPPAPTSTTYSDLNMNKEIHEGDTHCPLL